MVIIYIGHERSWWTCGHRKMLWKVNWEIPGDQSILSQRGDIVEGGTWQRTVVWRVEGHSFSPSLPVAAPKLFLWALWVLGFAVMKNSSLSAIYQSDLLLTILQVWQRERGKDQKHNYQEVDHGHHHLIGNFGRFIFHQDVDLSWFERGLCELVGSRKIEVKLSILKVSRFS